MADNPTSVPTAQTATIVDIPDPSPSQHPKPRPSFFRRRFLGLPVYVWLLLSALIAVGLLIYLIVALAARSDNPPTIDPSQVDRPPCDPSVDRFPTKITLDFASQATIPELVYSNTHVDFTIRATANGEAEYLYRLAPADCDAPEDPARTAIRAQPSALFIGESPSLAYVQAVDPQLTTLSFIPQASTFFSPTVQARVTDGLTLEIAEDFESNYTLLTTADTPPQLSLVGEFQVQGFTAAGTGLPSLVVADPSAQSPLERAEWVKLIGLILGRETVATRRFADVQQRYNVLRDSVADFPERPSVFFNRPFEDTWFVPGGEQYIAVLATDAGADYRFANDGNAASVALGFDEVRADFGNAEFLLNTSEFPPQNDSTLATFFRDAEGDEQRELYRDLRAVRCGNVFSSSGRVSEGGMSSDFFESGAIRPDLMLADFVDVLHRGKRDGLRYQYWLGPATPEVVGDGQCIEETRRDVRWDGLEHHFVVKGRDRWEMERVVARARGMLRGMRDVRGRRWRVYFTNGGKKGEVGVAFKVEVRAEERGTERMRGKMRRVKLALMRKLGQEAHALSRKEFKRRVKARAAAVRATTRGAVRLL